MSVVIFRKTIKNVLYEIREYNQFRGEYDLIVDGRMVLDSKSKESCKDKILELVGD